MKDRSSLRHNANAAKRPQCGTAGDHPGAAQTTGVRHVNLGNRIGSRASAAAGFSSDRSANCERRPSRAVLTRRCGTNQPSPEMQGHDHRQGDGQKDTKKKRSGNQGGQHGERRHHSPSLTHDCVAPRRGQVHDFAQGADRPRPQCSLEPVRRASRPIPRSQPLRDNSLQPHLAGVLEHDGAFRVLQVLVGPHARSALAVPGVHFPIACPRNRHFVTSVTAYL